MRVYSAHTTQARTNGDIIDLTASEGSSPAAHVAKVDTRGLKEVKSEENMNKKSLITPSSSQSRVHKLERVLAHMHARTERFSPNRAMSASATAARNTTARQRTARMNSPGTISLIVHSLLL